MTKSQVLLWFVALIYNKRKFQLEVSENEEVFRSKFTDPMEVTAGFD